MAKEISPQAPSVPGLNGHHLPCCRRQFLFKGSLLAAVAAALPATSWGSRVLPGLVPLSDLDLETFTVLLGTSFKVYPTQGGIVGLQLQKAQSLSFAEQPSLRASDTQWECFSLVFSGPPGQPLPQNTYCFEHRLVGKFNMFIVPIGQPSDGVPRYQAVFNRLADSPNSRFEAPTKENAV